MTIHLKRNDAGRTISHQLRDRYGPVDLEAASAAKFLLRPDPSEATAPTIDGVAEIDPDQNANPGKVSYTFTESDLDGLSGTFYGEYEVVWTNARATFPSKGYILVIVEPDLG